MNPKLQAIKKNSMLDEEGLSAPNLSASHASIFGTSAFSAENETVGMNAMQPTSGIEEDPMDVFTRQREVENLRLQINQLPDGPAKDRALSSLNTAVGAAGPSGIPNATTIAAVTQDTDAAVRESTKNTDVTQASASLLNAAVVAGFLAGFTELPHLAPILTPAHSQLVAEYALLHDHGVPGSGRSADRSDLGIMPVPAGLPAISQEIRQARNAEYTRNIAEDKKLS